MESLNNEVSNLSDLITQLKTVSGDQPNSVLLNIIQGLIGNDIIIKYDGKKIDVDLESKVGGDLESNVSIENNVDPDHKAEPCEHKGRFSSADNYVIDKILLTSTQRCDFKKELIRQCNGIVIELRTWKILCWPAPMFTQQVKVGELRVEDYHVYEVFDGTTISLYWCGKWCISSTNGLEMNNLKWIGPLTYLEAFLESANHFPKFSMDRLDRSNSYTIGFRHSDFHPLQDEKTPKMWLICVRNCSTGEIVDIDIGIPLQPTMQLPPIAENTGSNTDILEWMKQKNENALASYKSRGKNSSEIHYGFILRSKTNAPDYILRSTLLITVMKLIYTLPKRHYNTTLQLTSENRAEYFALKSHLSYHKRAEFEALFPQYGKYQEKFSRILTSLVNVIVESFKGIKKNTKTTLLDQRIAEIAHIMVDHLKKHGINIIDSGTLSIIVNYVTDVKYIDWYFACLINNI